MKNDCHTRSTKLRHNGFRRLVLCFVLLCGWGSGFAQTYPVYVTPSLMPPYSLKLSDYGTVGSQQLVVTIMVNDVNISNLPVKLHIRIEGSAGVTVETLPTLTTLPIYLNGGQTTLLFGADLADYFNLDNLVFSGYSKEQYRRTGYLPEGFYKFTVEILHYGTNRLISNRGLATAWMALGKPPVLRSPDEGAELGQVAGMPLTFSWLPSNVGIPSAGVQYAFELWELRIPGINPNVIAASMPAFHSVQQMHTALVVQPAELFLEQGMRYAWRVTAFDPMGRVSFEQDGHSEVRTFTYQARCDTVTNFIVERQATRGTFRWEAGVNHTSFNVEMRNPATAYFRQSQTFDNQVTYPSLDFGTTYQLRVQAVCNGDPQHVSAYSAWRTLAIPERTVDTTSCPDCRCTGSPSAPPITNFILRKDLQPGDIISNASGATRFILKTVVPQGDGVYKGLFWFWAEIWNLKILCEYWDLSVNTDNVMVKVDYESVYNPQFLLDVDAAKDYINNLADAIAEVATNTNIRDTVKLDVPLKGIYTNGSGELIAVTENPDGTLTETALQVDGKLNRTLIQGTDGEEYVVTSDGQVMGVEEFEQTGGNGRLMDNYKEEKEATAKPFVTFSASPNQKYGFDAYTEIKTNIQREYPELKPGYRPAFKSVASYAADKVQASVAESDITFRNEMGLPPLRNGNELTVRGGAGGSDVALYAYQGAGGEKEIVGKLNILSFDEQVRKLHIVSVNGAPLPDAGLLREELNRIYAQAVVRWEVVEGRKVQVSFTNGQLTHGGSGSWKVYNADQKRVFEAYGQMEKEALYLFFVKDVQGKEGVRGYMPLQYQQGFIYDNVDDATLIAHELAHGAFTLYHTFGDKQYIAPQGATSNLMDYNNGAELWKHQWQLINDPQHLWFKSWQDEEEGEAATNVVVTLNKLKTAIKTNTPAEISLKKKALLTTGSSFYALNSYNYKSIAIEARENISTMNVGEIQEAVHYLGNDVYYDLIIGNLLITLRTKEDRKMLYKYLTNTGNAILFVNGFKFGEKDTDNGITAYDRYDYWEGINLSFVNRLKSGKPFYADGHMDISTSNHKDEARFLCSARSCISLWPSGFKEAGLKLVGEGMVAIFSTKQTGWSSIPTACGNIILNTTPNLDGFNRRKAEGRIGGKNFVTQLKQASFVASDTLDIVCHSMGFAYALGMIEEIKTQMPDITLGGFYVIAPENGCSGGVNVSDWLEIWQYGSDELRDAIYEQDGVAPQCPVKGLLPVQNKSGRAYIPDDAPKGFISSHSIENYKWIFTKIKGQEGYVTPRN